MRYDDRLATVLGQPAADARGRAVQWRQLVELTARGGEVSLDLQEKALSRIAQLMRDLPPDVVAATARAIAGRNVPADLIALFAAKGATASAALLTAADLSAGEWSRVREAAAADVLPLLAALESSGEPAREAPVPVPVLPSEPQAVNPVREKPLQAPATVQTPVEAALPPGLFRWETGPNGEIDWVEGVPRAALIGRNLAESFADRFSARLPFADEPLALAEEGRLAGEWRWNGAPAFYADTGRFAGYRGLARREGTSPEVATAAVRVSSSGEDDGLRELVHELRTPLNAIIGFGEIIEGQYLGPAHRSYRERATEIVRQARGLSDAVDNLDLAARLRSGRLQGERTSGLEAVRVALEELRVRASERELRMSIQDRAGPARVALPPLLAERLVGQFARAMVEAGVSGERLAIVIDRDEAQVAIGIEQPMALSGLSEEQVLGDRKLASLRFALRLVQGLAAMTGGGLDVGADRLVLLLPLAN